MANSYNAGADNSHYKHGLHGIPEYEIWMAMKQRCYNKNHRHYANYGGRGITVCQQWLENFVTFLEDMGKRPTSKHTIERKDTDKGYDPDNCEWATRAVQSRNTRQNHWITFNGKTQCMTDWAHELGINLRTLSDRLRSGWPTEKALSQVVKSGKTQSRPTQS